MPTRYTAIIRVLPLIALLLFGTVADAATSATQAAPDAQEAALGAVALADGQAQFYNARYDQAAATALDVLRADPTDLAAYELRSTAILFQVRRSLGDAADKDKALKRCTGCPALLAAFQQNTTYGVARARQRLKADPQNDDTLFFLGKLDLNHVWLHLGTLGRKTGWSEYWEARHALDDVLQRNPTHARARIARAWIDYIVDTKASWGTRWILGGGNRKRALSVMREAASADEEFYTRAEARFALWDVQVRERNFGEALAAARHLALDFPNNAELVRFIDTHSRTADR